MKKIRSTFHKVHKHSGSGCIVCCLIMCVSLFLTACGRDDTSGSAASGESTAPDSNIPQGREWVYVPEMYTLQGQRVDYTRMQTVGDIFCYILQEETANSPKHICRYTLADGELEESPMEGITGIPGMWDTVFYAGSGVVYDRQCLSRGCQSHETVSL